MRRPSGSSVPEVVIAAVCAHGTSEIHNVRDIDRGYERIDERLRDLGANLERVPA